MAFWVHSDILTLDLLQPEGKKEEPNSFLKVRSFLCQFITTRNRSCVCF